MKVTMFDGCFDFGINVNDTRLSNEEIITKKIILHKVIEMIDDGESLGNMIRDLIYYVEPVVYENDNCDQCGNFSEYAEYEIN